MEQPRQPASWYDQFPLRLHIAQGVDVGAVTVVLLSTLLRVAFWIEADWTIEDGMIVARVVRNTVNLGVFSYNVDEKVSTLTSPLFGLLAALLTYVTDSPLFSAKAIGVLASVLTCLLLYHILRTLFSQRESTIATGIYMAFPPVIAYSLAGLETSLYAFMCCLTLERLFQHKNMMAFAIAAVCTLLRPDGAILLVLCGLITLRKHGCSKALMMISPGVALLGVGYAVHLVYFDALFPQTLVAKGTGYTVDPMQNTAKYLNRMLLAQPTGLPIYFLAVAGTAYVWTLQRRLLVFAIWYGVYHVFFFMRAPLFDWYLQPPLFVIGLFAGLGMLASIRYVCRLIGRSHWIDTLQILGGGLVVLVLIIALIPYGKAKQSYQRYEEEVRGAAGRWLSENAPENAVVFTESLGYIGYYSKQRFVDWPGLTNPRISEALDNAQLSPNQQYLIIISEFSPDYLVLREREWHELNRALSREYRVCAEFVPPNRVGPGYIVSCRAGPNQ